MAAQVEVQSTEVGRPMAGGRLNLSPLVDSNNKSIIASKGESQITTSVSDKPAPSPKPRLSPKPYAFEKNPTIKPILAPKPHTKPRPESTRISGQKPDLPNTPKPTARIASTTPNRPTSTSFKTSSKLNIGQTTKPIVQPFKPAPPLEVGDPSKPTRPVPAERQKPTPSNLSYSKSFKAAEWSGTTSKEHEIKQKKVGGSITRAKSMGHLDEIGQDEEEEKDKAQPEVAVPLRPKPRSSRPRPLSTIIPSESVKIGIPDHAPPWVPRRPLSTDLTSKFESLGLCLHRKSPLANAKDNSEGLEDATTSDPNNKKSEEPALTGTEETKSVPSIKSRISLLLDSSSPNSGTTGQVSDPTSPVSLVPEAEPTAGVKKLIKQLTEDTSPPQSLAPKPAPKPRPLPLDRTKKFSSERSPDLVLLTESADHHEISKDPQKGAEESANTSDDKTMLWDINGSPVERKNLQTSEESASKEICHFGEIQTVRASLFENVVDRQSVVMVDQSKSAEVSKESHDDLLKGEEAEDDGILTTATYKEPASPSPQWVSHAFDTIQPVEENRAVSESIPAAQREDKAMTLRSRRSEKSKAVIEQTNLTLSKRSEPQPRYLRIGALQKWNTTGLEQEGDKGNLMGSETDLQLVLEKENWHRVRELVEEPETPKPLKVLQPEQQVKPRATYFALTGQMQELASPVGGKTSLVDTTQSFEDSSIRSAHSGSQGQILSVQRNSSFKEAFEKPFYSLGMFDELIPRNQVTPVEVKSLPDEQTKLDISEAKKKREQLKEAEYDASRMKEMENDKQKQLEMKQAQLEFERMKELERQREYERQRHRAFEKEKESEERLRAREKERLLELEQQVHEMKKEDKLHALERQRQTELEKQKLHDLEKRKLMEKERQQQLQKEKERELERQKRIKKEKEREKERQRERDEERQREEKKKQKEMERQQLELEQQRQREKAEKEAEKLKQMAIEQELLRIKELEKEKAKRKEMEMIRQMEIEAELEKRRQRELEKERQRQLDMERQLLENERLRREKEKERQRNEELERLKDMEKQRLREKEAERIRQFALEQEMLRIRELEKERAKQIELEREHQREIEMEKQRELEKRKQRDLEKERQRQLDMENQQMENERLRREQEKERLRNEELKRLEEMEKQRLKEKAEKEAERIRQMALEQEMLRIRELEKERARQIELEREHQREIEMENRRQRDLEKERQRQLDRENQQMESERLRKEQEKERQRKEELERLKEMERRNLMEFEKQKQTDKERASLELEKRRAEEKMEKEEAEKLRQIAKQQEAEKQRIKEKQERLRLETSALRPKVLDLDSMLRNDQLSVTSPHSDPANRWREPYKPAILDIDSFTSQAQLSPTPDLFLASSIHGHNSEFGGRLQTTPEREDNRKALGGFSSTAWTSSQDPWELRSPVMSVDKPVPELRKTANKSSPQRPWSALLEPPQILFSSQSAEAGSSRDQPTSTPAELIWLPREPRPPKEGRHEEHSTRRSHGSKEISRMRSRSVSRRTAPSNNSVEQSEFRKRSRSAHKELDVSSTQKQSEVEPKDSGTPIHETDSQYGTWETGLRTDDSLTPATPTSESILSPSPRKPTSPHSPGAQIEAHTPDVLPPAGSPETRPLSFPDAPVTLLDNSALRSKAQLGKRRAPRTRPTRAARSTAPQTQGDGGDAEDWLFHDSTEPKVENKDNEPESHKEADPVPAVALQPQRVALFPGVDPAALKAQLKKRSEGDSPGDGALTSPPHVSRSPKSPFLPRAARVLPPPGGKENGEEDSPQWLKELKSKKRLSQYETES